MGDTFDFMREYLEKENEDRKMREAEAQFRYAERKKEKQENRRRIESTAMKVCDAVSTALAKPDTNYKPEELVGKKVVFVTNLAPRKVCGIVSEGMILAAEDENGTLSLIVPDKDINSGANLG